MFFTQILFTTTTYQPALHNRFNTTISSSIFPHLRSTLTDTKKILLETQTEKEKAIEVILLEQEPGPYIPTLFLFITIFIYHYFCLFR